MEQVSQQQLDAIALEIGKCIDARRDEMGLTFEQLAAKMATNPGQIHRLINGKRKLTIQWLHRFAMALDWDVESMVNTVDGGTERTVPIIGYVGAGERVFNFDDAAEIDRTEAPPDDTEMVAVIVRGESMLPRYSGGTLLFYTPTDHVADDCLGRACVVQIEDGPTLVKTLRKGSSPGLYRLVSTRAPEIEDAKLSWAARVRWAKEP